MDFSFLFHKKVKPDSFVDQLLDADSWVHMNTFLIYKFKKEVNMMEYYTVFLHKTFLDIVYDFYFKQIDSI